MPRPDVVVLVTGTGTDVGKTWTTAAVVAVLRADGRTVAARKPAQSFAADDRAPTDADVLAAATGERPHDVCPAHRWYPAALAPPMAADALGHDRITIDDLITELVWRTPAVDVGFVETAGGLRSPLAHDGDALTLADRLRPDLVLVVADPALGVLSHVRLAADALHRHEHHRVVVALNRYDGTDDLHARNRDWLARVDGIDVVTTPDAVAHRCDVLDRGVERAR